MLLGNPCHSYAGYRPFVLGTLPQLEVLDGEDVTHKERIEAVQAREDLLPKIVEQQETYRKVGGSHLAYS